jgi:hypothetical protein
MLHLHQIVERTFAFEVWNMLSATSEKGGAPIVGSPPLCGYFSAEPAR